MTTTIPITFCCTLCPVGIDAFYTRSMAEFLEHLQTMHWMVPSRWVKGFPLASHQDWVMCRKCGGETSPHFDGYCASCYQAIVSD